MKCKDPCPGSCGNDALCQVSNHVVHCTCPDGFSGNPFSNCYRVQACKKYYFVNIETFFPSHRKC